MTTASTEGHSRILLVSNSSLPFTEARTNPLGVMHKAIIVTPDDAERRIVNSTMLAVGGEEIGVNVGERSAVFGARSPVLWAGLSARAQQMADSVRTLGNPVMQQYKAHHSDTTCQPAGRQFAWILGTYFLVAENRTRPLNGRR